MSVLAWDGDAEIGAQPGAAGGGRAGTSDSEGRTVELSVTDERWRQFVGSRPEAGPFHHPSWALTIGEAYGFRPFGLLVQTKHGQVGLPMIEVRARPLRRKWVALPFTDHCLPLGGDSVVGSDLAVRLAAARARSGVRRLEVRAPLEGDAAQLAGTAIWHVLRLRADEQEVFRSFHRNQVQRNVRRAEREGVTVRRSGAEEDLTQVFHTLHTHTRRRHGVPVQPRRYFTVLWRRMIREGLGFVSVAEVEGAPAAAAVFLVHNGTIVYKYGASDPAYHRTRANHLLFWDAIRWGCQNDCHTFDFGRTAHADESLQEFKSRWGTEGRTLAYSVIADRSELPSASEVPSAARAVIRRAPVGFGRAVGAALYRYTA